MRLSGFSLCLLAGNHDILMGISHPDEKPRVYLLVSQPVDWITGPPGKSLKTGRVGHFLNGSTGSLSPRMDELGDQK